MKKKKKKKNRQNFRSNRSIIIKTREGRTKRIGRSWNTVCVRHLCHFTAVVHLEVLLRAPTLEGVSVIPPRTVSSSCYHFNCKTWIDVYISLRYSQYVRISPLGYLDIPISAEIATSNDGRKEPKKIPRRKNRDDSISLPSFLAALRNPSGRILTNFARNVPTHRVILQLRVGDYSVARISPERRALKRR